MVKNNIEELTELEFEELLLTVMVGVYVRTAVLESQRRGFKKIEKQLDLFLRLAENSGHKNLIQMYNSARLPNDNLEKREERIIEAYNEEEFWESLEVRLGQRDFQEESTKEKLEEVYKSLWLPPIIHKYYERYRKEFEKHGLKRLRIVKKKGVGT